MISTPSLAAIFSPEVTQQIVGWGLLVLCLLLSNIVAAKIFAPEAKTLVLLAASLLQVVFVSALIVTLTLSRIHGWVAVVIAALVVFVIWALANGGIYRFPFPSSLGYTAIAAVVIVTVVTGFHFFVEAGYFERVTSWKWKSPVRAFADQMEASAKVMKISGSRNFATVEEAQAAAVKRYPDLGRTGTEFNRRFVEKYNHYKTNAPNFLNTPNWPWLLAAQVAAEIGRPYDAE